MRLPRRGRAKSALAAARKFLDLIDARREWLHPGCPCKQYHPGDGGKAPNIIPDYVKLRMEFRTATMKSMGAVDEMVKKNVRTALPWLWIAP